MLKFLSNCYEKAMNVLAVITLIIFAAIGFIFCYGFFWRDSITQVIMSILGLISGGIIGFIFDILMFGFVAQIIEIKKLLKK